MNITCSVSSCACHGTCLPGSYLTLQSSTCSPPIAWMRTPSTNSNASRPSRGRGAEDPAIGGEERLAGVRRERLHREVLVEDDALSVPYRLALRLDRRE